MLTEYYYYRSQIKERCVNIQTTRWKTAGIGFVRGQLRPAAGSQ